MSTHNVFVVLPAPLGALLVVHHHPPQLLLLLPRLVPHLEEEGEGGEEEESEKEERNSNVMMMIDDGRFGEQERHEHDTNEHEFSVFSSLFMLWCLSARAVGDPQLGIHESG